MTKYKVNKKKLVKLWIENVINGEQPLAAYRSIRAAYKAKQALLAAGMTERDLTIIKILLDEAFVNSCDAY